eukprot:94564-Rhodomonas_salina.1
MSDRSAPLFRSGSEHAICSDLTHTRGALDDSECAMRRSDGARGGAVSVLLLFRPDANETLTMAGVSSVTYNRCSPRFASHDVLFRIQRQRESQTASQRQRQGPARQKDAKATQTETHAGENHNDTRGSTARVDASERSQTQPLTRHS